MYMPRLSADGLSWNRQPWDFGSDAPVKRYGSGEVANAQAQATIPAVPGQTAYVTGFEVWAGGATAAALVDLTVAGLLGGSQLFPVAIPAGVAAMAPVLVFNFDVPIAASALNTAITATLPALGAGNVKAEVFVKGFTA